MEGKIGPYFSPNRGVRQGCPLSCLLFDLCMEPLAIRLRNELSGISLKSPHHINTENLVTSLMADDITIYFSIEDIPKILKIFREWEKGSGMKLNSHKTHVLWLGAMRGSTKCVGFFKPKSPEETFKLVGIEFDSDGRFTTTQWQGIIAKMTDRLPIARVLKLSIFGRSGLANSFALSMLWYLAQCCVPITQDIINKVYAIIFYYIWRGKHVGQVQRDFCLNLKSAGGTGVLDIWADIRGFYAQWVRRLFDPSDRPWKTLFCHFIGEMTWPYNLHLGLFDPAAKNIAVPSSTPQAFKVIVKAWREIQAIPDRKNLHRDQIANQI